MGTLSGCKGEVNASMRKLVMKSIGQVGLEEVEKPSIGEQDVLIKVKACGLCGTDLHIFRDPNAFGDPFAHPLGHEITGQVVEVGAKVSHVQVGDGVVIDNATNCGVCRNCKNGDPGAITLSTCCWKIRSCPGICAVPARSVYKFEGLSYAELPWRNP